MSAFGAATSADEIVAGLDLSDKTMLVTGASSGLGIEATRVLAAAGAKVIMAVRDLDKARRVADSLQDLVPHARIELVKLELAELCSVRECADQVLSSNSKLDVLINNAAVMAIPLAHTVHGFELQFATNYLGHFLLTCLLVPSLKRVHGARIVIVSSYAHRYGDVDFDDLHYQRRPYDKWQAYGQSKTANVLFAVGLTKRLKKFGITANALHPGAINTDLGRALTTEERDELRKNNPNTFWKTPAQGAATEVWAAVSPDLAGVGGRYLEDCRLAELAADQQSPGYFAYAVDEDAAERLWDLSERLVGQRFPF